MSHYHKTLIDAEKAINEGKLKEAFDIICEHYREHFSDERLTIRISKSIEELNFLLQDLLNQLERFGTIHKRPGVIPITENQKKFYCEKIEACRRLVERLESECKILLLRIKQEE